MIRFITEYRDRFGVELICRVLRPAVQGFLTARGYRAAVDRAPSARQLKDKLLVPEIRAVGCGELRRLRATEDARAHAWARLADRSRPDRTPHAARWGARRPEVEASVHYALRQDDRPAERSREPSFHGAGTTAALGLRRDLRRDVEWFRLRRVRHRRLLAPHRRVERRIDAARRDPPDAGARHGRLGRWRRSDGRDASLGPRVELHGDGLYTDRIAELGAGPSTGTVGDSYDNALAEAVNNLYKTELIRQRGPWRTVEQVELATLEWVWWWNNQRPHGELDMRTPLEVEQAYYADLESANPAPAGQGSR